jgi:hypothetical protein
MGRESTRNPRRRWRRGLGAQRTIAAFDPQVDHRDAVETPAYIFNFIFKPRR